MATRMEGWSLGCCEDLCRKCPKIIPTSLTINPRLSLRSSSLNIATMIKLCPALHACSVWTPRTALHHAVVAGSDNSVRTLLEAKAVLARLLGLWLEHAAYAACHVPNNPKASLPQNR